MVDSATPVEVDVNTDDLDAFTDLFTGKAVEKPATAVEPVVAEPDTGATDEDDELEADEPVVEAAAEEVPADGDAPVEEDEDEDILKPKPKKKQTVQERISELTRLRHEAERREADALRRLAEAEATRVSPKPTDTPVQPAKAVEAGAPDPAAQHGDGSMVYPLGEFDPSYVRDLTVFYTRKENEAAVAERFEREEADRQQVASIKLQTDWAGKLTEVEKDIPDLRPTIASLEAELKDLEPNFGTYLAQTIMGMPVGPKVLYYLANNVDEAQKIIAAGPVGATLALGKLEDKIERNEARKASKQAAPARVSVAPEPPVTTRGTASRVQVADDTDDLDAFEAKFFKQK